MEAADGFAGRVVVGLFSPLNSGRAIALQAEPRPPSSHPAAETQGHQPGRLRRGPAPTWEPHGLIHGRGDRGLAGRPRTTPDGQPCCAPLAILTALTLCAMFRLALCQIEGLIGSIIGLLGLELRVPDHSTLSRWAKTLEVPRRGGKPPLALK